MATTWNPRRSLWGGIIALQVLFALSGDTYSQLAGEGPRLGPYAGRMKQDWIETGTFSLKELRAAGLAIFSTPFNQYDGFGDGPVDSTDTTGFGNRPTLQGNGRNLRVNGLDAQTCLECHGILSTATSPPSLGIGGSGTTATVAMFMPQNIDVDDSDGNGWVAYDGRLIVPPHLFGVGGVQLVGQEMTMELQAQRALAIANPGMTVDLVAKGVSFGSIVADTSGSLDTSNVEGVDQDLVIKPFGRKGEFATVRGFDRDATQFHLGMQPVEIVGEGIDEDGDGVTDELLVGELSVLEIFLTTQERPIEDFPTLESTQGRALFESIGCADRHRPEMATQSRQLRYTFPQVDTDPKANAFYQMDLSKKPTRFERIPGAGVRVPLFSDLKRHDMGPGLAETFQGADADRNAEFITAKLWGVADTAPYLHDGRAHTLMEAILLHGGEAENARDTFDALPESEQGKVLAFLRTLRTPIRPNRDVAPFAPRRPSSRLNP